MILLIISITSYNVTCRSPVCSSSYATSLEDKSCHKLSPFKGLSSIEIYSLAISWVSFVVNLLKIDILYSGLNGIYGYILLKLLNNPYAILLYHLFPSLNFSVLKYFSSSNAFNTLSITIAFSFCWRLHSFSNMITLNLRDPHI